MQLASKAEREFSPRQVRFFDERRVSDSPTLVKSSESHTGAARATGDHPAG